MARLELLHGARNIDALRSTRTNRPRLPPRLPDPAGALVAPSTSTRRSQPRGRQPSTRGRTRRPPNRRSGRGRRGAIAALPRGRRPHRRDHHRPNDALPRRDAPRGRGRRPRPGRSRPGLPRAWLAALIPNSQSSPRCADDRRYRARLLLARGSGSSAVLVSSCRIAWEEVHARPLLIASRDETGSALAAPTTARAHGRPRLDESGHQLSGRWRYRITGFAVRDMSPSIHIVSSRATSSTRPM